VVEEPRALEAEVKLAEQDVASVRPGQAVEFRARALPLRAFRGTVLAKAAVATAADPKEGQVQGTVTVYCRIEDPPAALQSGMSGSARVHCGRESLAASAAKRVMKFLRTEFWW
jgi:hypothetical protein